MGAFLKGFDQDELDSSSPLPCSAEHERRERALAGGSALTPEGCQFNPQSGRMEEAPDPRVSLTSRFLSLSISFCLSPSRLPSLKSISMPSGED